MVRHRTCQGPVCTSTSHNTVRFTEEVGWRVILLRDQVAFEEESKESDQDRTVRLTMSTASGGRACETIQACGMGRGGNRSRDERRGAQGRVVPQFSPGLPSRRRWWVGLSRAQEGGRS